MPVTLKDVAEHANVSIKTVSRVVNQQGEISEETRARVQEAIEQLGYYPNLLARSLVNQRSYTIAVVAAGIEYFGPSRTLVGIKEQAEEFGYSLVLDLMPHLESASAPRLLQQLASRRVEGIVWAVPEIADNHDWVRHADLTKLPPLVFLSMSWRPRLSVFAVDNRLGAKQATRHLIEQGRQHIGIITGPLTWWEARERLAGWEEALSEAGLPANESLVANGDWTPLAGEQGMQVLLSRVPRLDGLFASNDQMALGAFGVLQRAGIGIPADIALVGFDDIPESEFFTPRLTTVHQPLIDVGRVAMQELHAHIEAERSAKRGRRTPQALSSKMVLIPPQLIVRQSTSPDTSGGNANQ